MSLKRSSIDDHRAAQQAYFSRDPDRPDTAFAAKRVPMTAEERRAKDRVRSAAYRQNLDRRRRPERSVVATALLEELVTTYSFAELTSGEVGVVGRMFQNLVDRGFDRREVEDVIRSFKANIRKSAFE
jgi:hypothetical protein